MDEDLTGSGVGFTKTSVTKRGAANSALKMSDSLKNGFKLPPEQQAIRDKCFPPSGTFVEFPKEEIEQSMPARFEKIVRMYPGRLAVKMGGRALTYGELNRYANRIAHGILQKRGPGSEPIVLLFEHSIEVIAAIFGVLKAGKFYVALDPTFPLERISYIVEDSGAGLIATNSGNTDLASKLKNDTRTLLNIDEINNSYSSDNIGLSVSPDDIVTICYTSGSTGKPKGVVQAHRNVLHSVKLLTESTRIRVDDRLTLLHSLSFASGHAHLRISLLNGASLFPFDIKSEGVHRLAKWLEDEQLTVYHSPPSLFRQLAESLSGREKFESLRLIRLSGAPVTQLDFDLYKKNFGPETLLEFGMGSTEARGIGSAMVDRTFTFPEQGVPIGYPPPEKKILLLNENGRQVEFGQVGEIAIMGRNLNLGYWNQPDLTGAKFLADPTGGNERIYLTGDLGRMMPYGFLIHLGRKDLMVKVRGYRVELGEIEMALLTHPHVKDAGVAAWDREPGEKYLAGYVVLRQGSALNVSDLKVFLRKTLPDYMLPSTFMFLESLPLTNGKLDRSALPKPDNRRPDLKAEYVSPNTETEKRLSLIWSEVLSLDQVGIQDNFFDLGGHSLLAMRIASGVARDFQVELPTKLFFESSTIASHADYIERAHLTGSKGNSHLIPVVSRQGQLPLSFGQERLWFLNQLEPESSLYNEPRALRLIGFLDVRALEKALNHIIARHEVLRTAIVLVDGNPMQRIADRRMIELPVIDLRTHNAEDRDTEARRLIDETIRRPFDLSSDLVLRALLLRLNDQEHILLVVKHHVATDGWSGGIFWQEVAALYDTFTSGRSADLRELPAQYADYAAWQREWLQGAVLETQLSYWRKQLDNLTTLQLPTDRPRPAFPSFQGAKQTLVLSNDFSQALRALSRNEGVTLFMTLLAAFQILLHRYTGQEDIAIGSLISGRNWVEIEGLIGFFVNTLVLRTDVSGVPTFRELLQRVRGVCLGAYSHQDLPFEKLVQELQPERSLNSNPLFQVLFQLSNEPRTMKELPAIKVEDLDLDGWVSKFDLSLSMADNGSEITGRIEYSTDLFNAETIERMQDQFRNLLEGIIANPEQRISELPLLTKAEKYQKLVEWNDTKRDYPKDKCVHHLIEEQVERSPEAVAVVFEDQQVSYRELNKRANQLAHYLRKRGVGPEVLVGICVNRSIEMIVGILSVLKAGAAYVPLDPSFPAERLEFMLADAQVSVLLTQEGLFEGGSRMDDRYRRSAILDRPVQRICLDRNWQLIARESDANPESSTATDALAYVIYTSGSTGRPKGVAIEHRNTAAFLGWVHSTFTTEELSGVFAATSIGFDLSVFEIFAPLTCGGTVVMAVNALALATIRDLSTVTLINTVPSAMNELLRLDAIPPSVSVINLAGEPLRSELVRRIFESTPARKVHDLYGPTECTTYSTWMCRTADGPQSIGRPIANTQVYILDAHRNLVPIGVVGEIYIGGDGVARGYLNQPELTAEKFIYHSFSAEPAKRLYKTGDLARYLADGNIEFLGRIDTQVKIRGYRIELGEIEAVLGQHRAVQTSVVAVREDEPDDKRLVGYVVTQPGESFDAAEVRRYLKQKLPEYMIPSALVLLDELPLTPSGKMDRKALPAPDQNRPQLEDVYQPPSTATEETLAAIWREVLKLDKVGAHDNFFELGGHSLLATQIVSRIRNAFSIEFPLRTLFESPTVIEMAATIDQNNAKGASDADLARVLRKLEVMTEDDAQKLLAVESAQSSKGNGHE